MKVPIPSLMKPVDAMKNTAHVFRIVLPLLSSRKAPAPLAALLLFGSAGGALAQGTAFAYQGKLSVGTNAANGIYDLRVAIYDAASGPNLVAGPLTNSPVGVTNGLFIATLDFPSPAIHSGPSR